LRRSSTSSSSDAVRARAPALILAAVLAAGCAGPRQASPFRVEHDGAARVAVLPPHNLSGGLLDPEGLLTSVEDALRGAGLELSKRDEVDRFLTERRIRFTGGIDADTAADAREDLGVDAVLIVVVERYAEAPVPQLALTLRLVSATKLAETLWIDGVSMAGDEAPGLLGFGIIGTFEKLQARVVERCVRSLEAFLRGERRPASGCEGRGVQPRISFRSPRLDAQEQFTIAVLPFVNDTERRDAGDVVAQAVYRQLTATGRFRPFEQGVVRRLLLGLRVVQEEGVSLEEARLLTQTLGADLVIAGRVYAYFENPSAMEAPHVEFSVTAIHRGDKQTYWQSSSYARGDDGLHLFGLGKTATAGTLTCRMASAVAARMALPPGPEPGP
jgi:hypothetical protein